MAYSSEHPLPQQIAWLRADLAAAQRNRAQVRPSVSDVNASAQRCTVRLRLYYGGCVRRVVAITRDQFGTAFPPLSAARSLDTSRVACRVSRDNAPQVPWIVMFAHRPLYCSTNDYYDCRVAGPMKFAPAIEPLLRHFGVDLFLAGLSVALLCTCRDRSRRRLVATGTSAVSGVPPYDIWGFYICPAVLIHPFGSCPCGVCTAASCPRCRSCEPLASADGDNVFVCYASAQAICTTTSAACLSSTAPSSPRPTRSPKHQHTSSSGWRAT